MKAKEGSGASRHSRSHQPSSLPQDTTFLSAYHKCPRNLQQFTRARLSKRRCGGGEEGKGEYNFLSPRFSKLKKSYPKPNHRPCHTYPRSHGLWRQQSLNHNTQVKSTFNLSRGKLDAWRRQEKHATYQSYWYLKSSQLRSSLKGCVPPRWAWTWGGGLRQKILLPTAFLWQSVLRLSTTRSKNTFLARIGTRSLWWWT